MNGVAVGLRDLHADPMLGLRTVTTECADIDGAEVDGFVGFLRECARLGGGHDAARDAVSLDAVAGSPVSWRRIRNILYPVYMEYLTIVPRQSLPSPRLPVPAVVVRPGHWQVADSVLRPGPEHYRSQEAMWREVFSPTFAAEAGLGGGLAVNVLEVPPGALRSGAVDIRPLVLHALRPDGGACDRGRPAAQRAVANSFWQTFWATGALRSERGITFPVAFLPIDRSCPIEFLGPFRERYVSLRRRLFGRTAILAFVNETLTARDALLFDTRSNCFGVAEGFDAESAGVQPRDVALALHELNRTAFVDAYTGDNAVLFAAWLTREEQACDGEAFDEARVPSAANLSGLALSPAAEGVCVIRRVVPYAGGAYLSEVVNHTNELRSAGKIQEFDDEIIAATNSTFFLNFPEEYSAMHCAMNDPVSLLVENGRTHQIRTMRRAAFVIDRTGAASITTRAANALKSEALLFEGESVSVTAYRRACGPFRENRYGPLFFGVVIVGRSIVETFEETQTEIPGNGWIIGDSEAFGGAVDPEDVAEVVVPPAAGGPAVPVRHAFAVGPLLLAEGKMVPLGESREEFQPIVLRENPSAEETARLPRTGLPQALLDCEKMGVSPTRFPYDWNETRAPRTAIGLRPDGTIVLAVVDGRADLSHSVGVSLAELARLMQNLGCSDAMNLDGGGSSVMFVNDPAAAAYKWNATLRDGVVSLPSDPGGIERMLPVALVLTRRRAQSPTA
ncbi:MAG: phosphodiester glycosidase family protein [Candidatus Sumerlaeaceae bacterium]|nr:phosphodiester glycosidase family protein [Candidatus Sumerlaeaceae bacterium]